MLLWPTLLLFWTVLYYMLILNQLCILNKTITGGQVSREQSVVSSSTKRSTPSLRDAHAKLKAEALRRMELANGECNLNFHV